MTKYEVTYIERVVKKIMIEANDVQDAGRKVIMCHVDVDSSKASIVDSLVWSVERVVKV